MAVFISQCPTESKRKQAVIGLNLEGMTSAGVWSALEVVSLFIIKIRERPSRAAVPRPLGQWPCLWTLLLVLCRFTKSPLKSWSLCTPSTTSSLSLWSLGFGSNQTPQCLSPLSHKLRHVFTFRESAEMGVCLLTPGVLEDLIRRAMGNYPICVL